MKKLFYLFAILFAVLFAACEGTEPPTSNKVETGAAENITATSATLKGMVNVDIIDYEEIVFGVMYSTKAEDLVDFTAPSKNGLVLIGNEFKVEVTDLKAETKYYYRAYVMLNTLQILLGDVKEFTTLAKSGSDEPENSANGHEYVDLGLSVKWAIMNVGATSPEDYGDYFAWGETEPKEEYSWETYKWCDGDFNNLTKYCSSSEFGIVDNKTVLDLEDDAANVNWGGAWRMPSKAELDELIENCTWSWTTQNGVDGYTVTSNTNGKSIFLPAAGYRNETFSDEVGTFGYYWSSLHDNANFQHISHNIYFEESNVDKDSDSRYYGNSIRPVLP